MISPTFDFDATVASSGFFQDLQKPIAAACRAQDGQTMIATAGNKMRILGAIVSLQDLWAPHESRRH